MKFILTRSIVFYLFCLCLLWPLFNYNKLISNAIPQTINQLTPAIDYFSEFIDKDDHYDRFKLVDCVNYHKAVGYFFSFQKAEALGMEGFCSERLGKTKDAIESYQQSIALNPDYFWPYYNLGVIAYRQAQYAKAADYFHQALELDPRKTIVLLFNSKVYNDVKLSDPGRNYDYLQGLQQGRHEAYILMMVSVSKAVAIHQQGIEVLDNYLKPRVRFF